MSGLRGFARLPAGAAASSASHKAFGLPLTSSLDRSVGRAACSVNGPFDPTGRRRMTPGFAIVAAMTLGSLLSFATPWWNRLSLRGWRRRTNCRDVKIPRPQRLAGRFQRVSFVFLGGAGEAVLASDRTDAEGGSPFACSRPTSRRGQEKSSARPAGGASGSPLTSVRAASGSTAAGRELGPPSN
jgi:hypothetical protein